MLWRKDALLMTHLEDELWLDKLGFAYGDDQLETFKLHSNSGRLGVLYDAGITNLDARSSSGSFRKSPDHIYIRTKASLMTWWRMCYKSGKDTTSSRILAAIAFGFKSIWLFLVMCVAALVKWDGHYLTAYCKGLRDGRKEVHSDAFQNLPPFVL